MKIDMSPEAVRARLEQVGSLRKLCLSLARSSAAREIAAKHPAKENPSRPQIILSGTISFQLLYDKPRRQSVLLRGAAPASSRNSAHLQQKS